MHTEESAHKLTGINFSIQVSCKDMSYVKLLYLILILQGFKELKYLNLSVNDD